MNETKYSQNLARILRRKHIAELIAKGRTVSEISKTLNAAEHVIRRDVKAIRLESSRRNPWGDPLSCAASFIEAAEEALQKVRSAQTDAEPTSTAYVNLVKLEWAMLIKFIEMTAGRQPRAAANRGENEDAEDLSNCTTDELIRKGRELGITLDEIRGHAPGALEADLEDAA